MRKRKEKKKGETYIFFKELTSTSFIFFFWIVAVGDSCTNT